MTTASMANRLLSANEVAEYLGVPLRTLYHWRRLDEGPRAYRVGKRLRFRLADVDAWLEQRADSDPAA
ncbi:helix-turn-helix domain-containing protein [Saccharopolyspora sp. K220]|uniref:helix-turn-helix transcriptional regulator n=1 Tax=Saccharopolyspora soli TaxID=2926618 RepID=UPI001F5A9DA1|nr:helix-turn-helix domain-containing protein [Saccharopolyspora soli]MCI2422758.1 helix-turn-helix domain-containing protein [Saccharopolyspora soli]